MYKIGIILDNGAIYFGNFNYILPGRPNWHIIHSDKPIKLIIKNNPYISASFNRIDSDYYFDWYVMQHTNDNAIHRYLFHILTRIDPI